MNWSLEHGINRVCEFTASCELIKRRLVEHQAKGQYTEADEDLSALVFWANQLSNLARNVRELLQERLEEEDRE